MSRDRAGRASQQTRILVPLLILAAAAGLYYGLRYGGWAVEGDTARQAVSADGVVATGRLVHGEAYNNGYGLGGQLAFLSTLTGLPVQALAGGASAWVAVVALVAFVAYRQLLGRPAVAGLATLLLLLQPDFLFYVLRGSHETLTWMYTLLLLYLLVRSRGWLERPSHLAVAVALFYLVFWAMTAGNVYFASSVMGLMALGFAGGWLMSRWRPGGEAASRERERTLRRLVLISLICLTMVYLFISYTYEPALAYYNLSSQLADRVGILLFGAQSTEAPVSYGYFEAAWRSLAGYLSLTAVQWLIAGLSLVAWGLELRRLAEADHRRWLLWLLYTAAGALLALGVLADYGGFLNENLQLRMFTIFCLFSSPMVARLIVEGYRRLGPRWRRGLVPVGAALAAYALVACLLKVTNDPTLGNQWFFYTPADAEAGEWVDGHLDGAMVWVDVWPQQADMFEFRQGYDPDRTNRYLYGRYYTFPPYVLLSERIRLRANRFGAALPSTVDRSRVYDNGLVRLYQRRPQTPYQR